MYGVQVESIFTSERTPDQVMNLIENLPRTSRFAEAIADDDELAEAMEHAPVASSGIRHSEYTPEVERLGVIADLLAGLIAGLSKGQAERLPVPQGAADRLRARREDELVGEIESDLKAAYERFTNEHKEG